MLFRGEMLPFPSTAISWRDKRRAFANVGLRGRGSDYFLEALHISGDRVHAEHQKTVLTHIVASTYGGWGDGSGGMESRQLSAGSGLMDNVPLDQRRRLVFISSALIIQVTWADATLSALCGRKQMVTLRRLLVTYLFPFIKKRIPSFWQNKPDLFPVWARGSILNQRIIYFWK